MGLLRWLKDVVDKVFRIKKRLNASANNKLESLSATFVVAPTPLPVRHGLLNSALPRLITSITGSLSVGSRIASLSKTLAGLVSSGVGFHPPTHLGVVTQTLQALSKSLNGVLKLKGSLSKTLAGLSLSSNASSSSPGSAINTSPPTITGTRGGTLTANPGTWTGSSSVSGRWYSDGSDTGNTTTSYNDTDTTTSLEYRETALPGSVTASAYRGAVANSTAIIFDPATATSGTTLSNGNLTARIEGSVLNEVLTQTGFSSGKHYFEVHQDSKSGGAGVGFVDALYTYDSSNKPGDANIHGYSPWSDGYPGGGGPGPGAWNSGDRLTFALDADNLIVYSAVNAAPNTSSGGKSLAGMTRPIKMASLGWFGIDIQTFNFGGSAFTYTPPVGYSAAASTSVSAFINPQSSGTAGYYQVDVTASTTIPSATALQYKVEEASGKLVQNWTNMTGTTSSSTATLLLTQFAFEGQSLRVLARNTGGTLSVADTTTPAVPYALSQTMKIGLNDGVWDYWGQQVPGRDFFEMLTEHPTGNMFVCTTDLQSYNGYGILSPGNTFPNYAHWDEVYNPAQPYPATSDPSDDNYVVCVYNGSQYRRVDHTPHTGKAPDPSDSLGTTCGWRLNYYCDSSVIGLNAKGWPTSLPADSHLTIGFFVTWDGFKSSRYPVTIHCKTEPGVQIDIHNAVNASQTNVNVPAGTFDLTITGATTLVLTVNRSTPISSAFFLSGVPTYETGTPALDIGTPYANKDKISDFTGFHAMRNMSAMPTNRAWKGVFGGMTAANSVPVGGRRWWKYNVDMAKQAGHKGIWVNMPDVVDNTFIDAMAQFFLDNLNSDQHVYLEMSNERWNFSFWQASELNTRAVEAGILNYQLHAREHNNMMSRWKTIWAGHTDRLHGVLAWQAGASLSTWQAMLDFESAYLNTDYIAPATYWGPAQYSDMSAGVTSAISSNNYSAFATAMDTLMRSYSDTQVTAMKAFFDWLPTYSIAKGRNKNAIQLSAYEGSPNILIFDSGTYDTNLGSGAGTRMINFSATYRRSALMGATYARYLDDVALKCPHLYMAFDYQGSPIGWGHMDRLGNSSDETYATLHTKALAYN